MISSMSGKAIAYLFILRWSIALIFLVEGFLKFQDPSFGVKSAEFFASLVDDAKFGFYKDFLSQVVVPNSNLFGLLVKFGEIGVGFAYLLGVPLKLASLAGSFMNLNYLMIATGPNMIYLNILMIICQFVIVGTHRN